jgi:hypothetical protein
MRKHILSFFKSKFFLIAYFFTILTGFITSITIYYYSEKQKEVLIDNLLDGYYPFIPIHRDGHDELYSINPQPIHLFALLYANIHAQKPEDYNGNWLAGKYTSKYYNDNWKNVVIKNPALIYKAWQLYGDESILNFNSKLGYYSTVENEFSTKFHIFKFNRSEFWSAQKSLIRQYKLLISELLKLDDKKLNFYISSAKMNDESSSFDFNNWLKEKGLLPNNILFPYYFGPPRADNCYLYPGDLLLLTNRIRQSSPEWTPRRFLTEANKLASIILLSIENNID